MMNEAAKRKEGTVRSYTLRLYPNPGKAKTAFGILLEQRAWLYEFVRQHMATGEETWTTSTQGLGKAANRALRRAHAIVKAGRNSSIATGSQFNEPRVLPLIGDGTIEQSNTPTFEYWVKMTPGPRLPAKSHQGLNKALRAGGTLTNTAEIAIDKRGRLIARVFVRFEIPQSPHTGDYIGVDVGINHGLCTSEGYQGKSLRPFLDKTTAKNAERQRQGHLHKLQSRRSACKQFLDREARRLVASAKRGGKSIAIESLKTLGTLRTKGSIGAWPRMHLGMRVLQFAELAGVTVQETYTPGSSITCRACEYRDPKNRSGVSFRCLQCGAIGHADEWASLTIRDRARQAFLRERHKVTKNAESRVTRILREGAFC